jgi:hypothetical protein
MLLWQSKTPKQVCVTVGKQISTLPNESKLKELRIPRCFEYLEQDLMHQTLFKLGSF